MKTLLKIFLVFHFALFITNQSTALAGTNYDLDLNNIDAETVQCMDVHVEAMVEYDDFVRVFVRISLNNVKGQQDVEFEHGHKVRHILPLTMGPGDIIYLQLILPRLEDDYTTTLEGRVLNNPGCNGDTAVLTVPGTSNGPLCIGC